MKNKSCFTPLVVVTAGMVVLCQLGLVNCFQGTGSNFFVFTRSNHHGVKSKSTVGGGGGGMFLELQQLDNLETIDKQNHKRRSSSNNHLYRNKNNQNNNLSKKPPLSSIDYSLPLNSNYNNTSNNNDQQHQHMTTTQQCNLQIHKIAKSGTPDCGKRANQILNYMHHKQQNNPFSRIQPDIFTYNGVINAWAKGGDANSAKRAEQLLRNMEENKDDEWLIRPNVRSYTTVLNAWAKASAAAAASASSSSATTTNSDQQGGGRSAAQRAESLLQHMQTLYQINGEESMKPNTYSYNCVINAWARSGEVGAPKKAEDILNKMLQRYNNTTTTTQTNIDTVIPEPDHVSFNCVINAWAKSSPSHHHNTTPQQHAENLLTKMDELYKQTRNPNHKPNVRTYTSVLDAYAKSGSTEAASHAEELLQRMEELYQYSYLDERPNTFTYSVVIHTWSRSKDPNKAQKALRLLTRMEELSGGTSSSGGGNANVRPSVVTYNSVLNACATSVGSSSAVEQMEAFQIASRIYDKLHNSQNGNGHITPDHFTYGTYLKACANLMPVESMERSNLLQQIFQDCCDNGQVSDGVVTVLRQAAPAELYRMLLKGCLLEKSQGGDGVKVKQLPKEWVRNLKEKKRGGGRGVMFSSSSSSSMIRNTSTGRRKKQR